ncbi:MAG: hypothetical protein KGJ29_09675, partial [Hyphomicrobiales bacterium]|nr:hypothetical protein [Hyphomicrobiales bacterium]
NAVTLIAVAILVGTEFIGTAWAAGWAIGGYYQLGPTISHVVEIAGALIGAALLFYFMRVAIRAEPFRG